MKGVYDVTMYYTTKYCVTVTAEDECAAIILAHSMKPEASEILSNLELRYGYTEVEAINDND